MSRGICSLIHQARSATRRSRPASFGTGIRRNRSACAPPASTRYPERRRMAMLNGGDGSTAMVRIIRRIAPRWRRSVPSGSGSTVQSRTSLTASRASSTTAFRQGRREQPAHHALLGRTSPPIRSRATISGFVTEDIRWGKFEAGYDTKALDRQGQPRGSLARGGQERSVPRSHRYPGRRRRAARKPSSTARCSIPTIPPPTSRA